MQQLQNLLRQGVGLGKHCGACLLHDLQAGKLGSFRGEVGFASAEPAGRHILGRGLEL